MFVAQAHSFAQQARLAITLAWIAGYTNTITLLACGSASSHVTGTTSSLGQDIAGGKWSLATYALYLLVTFFFGAVISGFSTELGRRRTWESIYVLPMAIQAILLAAFATALELHGETRAEAGSALFWLTGIASMAMGLQNATITRISSGVVRTTHVTGVLTDLGLEFVQFLWWIRDRRRDFPPSTAQGDARSTALMGMIRSAHAHPTGRRLAILFSIFASFAVGAGLATFAHDFSPRWSMIPPVLFLIWIIYQDISRPIVEIEASDLLSAHHGLDLPKALAIFHLRKSQGQTGRMHRMPDLLAWCERLPATTQVVILDLCEVTQIDPNAALELRSVLNRFHTQNRRLVVAGLSPEHYKQLRSVESSHHLEPADLCPDLDLAIARGLNLLEDLCAGTRGH